MPLPIEHLKNVAAALRLIEEAQMRLYAATRFLNRVPGIDDLADSTCDAADSIKTLWYSVESSPMCRMSNGATANRYRPDPPSMDC